MGSISDCDFLFCISLMTNDGEHLFMCLFISFSYLFFGEMCIPVFSRLVVHWVVLFSLNYRGECECQVSIHSEYESFTWYTISDIYSVFSFLWQDGTAGSQDLLDLSSLSRDRKWPMAVKEPSANHWTTREFSYYSIRPPPPILSFS